MSDRIVIRANGYAGDCSGEAMAALPALSDMLGELFGAEIIAFGDPQDARDMAWQTALEASEGLLSGLAEATARTLQKDAVPIIATPRCAAALASIPAVLARRDDAHVVWFDAHGDLHTPATTRTGYLGGMPITALLGEWQSGYGAGLRPERLLHLGGRDLEDAERAFIERHGIFAASFADFDHDLGRIEQELTGKKVFVHLDCDVFDPRDVTADYRVPGGLRSEQAAAVFSVIARVSDLVGLEITEFSPGNAAEMQRSLASLRQALTALAGQDQEKPFAG
ncbi:arginase family protein [Denitrobaculum tricleocarpae]|uniref:Arginase family protein n=1 Tax=Denitrobaculum tricleocarpae TaxID=2591009 RepID=A0A545TRU0_9PROT|nr:arginase family protein [Denitrobaculum tricleocarpae]TQV79935.1 arginase family protein [Denitrobaculum tricleocarpae]